MNFRRLTLVVQRFYPCRVSVESKKNENDAQQHTFENYAFCCNLIDLGYFSINLLLYLILKSSFEIFAENELLKTVIPTHFIAIPCLSLKEFALFSTEFLSKDCPLFVPSTVIKPIFAQTLE